MDDHGGEGRWQELEKCTQAKVWLGGILAHFIKNMYVYIHIVLTYKYILRKTSSPLINETKNPLLSCALSPDDQFCYLHLISELD